MYTKQTKEKARKLREQGVSYNKLQRMLDIPKSTLSSWFSESLGMPFDRKTLLKHLANIRILSAKVKRKNKMDELEKIQKKADEEILSYPLDLVSFQKSLISMLYWAEGAKHEKVSGLIFVNTDPKLLELFISLLRNCYELDEKKFRVRLHLHYYHPIKETRQFWSKLLEIPESQFTKTLIKRRSLKKRFRKNFHGICILSYLSSSIRKEILALGYAIHNQIKPS
ncbi:MAG: hypothetical protein A3E02_00010 [Candidatus Zambryskibacteria bacterium RIFCSPHIGHO2_12_FULL_38_34]|uniref:Uncharacterized protein n=1 Tax=Candidatus Zambryskibacteria bacterium RIFCSPLOWO2_12_FULL_39_16 TaxID=1802775 RepID=A0A1G2US56_9BACT|nr:MAG: hypothetical protein A3D37_00545 [Candidatus Zambryskibacteria bacterium RIFCSPHIGHO2_02_FULL_38_22]OHA97772.1 MAG: hypothetical protein A3E02_00010 [Candidatus Zambryskibacteria bacterium RIFCSPHIGHO2_12_FULL_38_34]OHB08607.1 MAG: hypothetical protein A3I19_00650 [Candidatus Zambryskibacteria bacterium RIFCSPLOWO2_02_FULL_38_13]OHB12233.1 MAG: hypothetical protein A3G46_01250 [Candidatus Zambryskibacteria bacterium RIFCSPLOWO2_12_FULL_39_16]